MPDVFDMATVAERLRLDAPADRLRVAAALVDSAAASDDPVFKLKAFIRAAIIASDVGRQLTNIVQLGVRARDDSSR